MLRKITTILPLLPLLVLAGCDRSTTEPEHGEPDRVELRDRDTGALLASSDGSSWVGELPDIEVGEGIEVDALFFDEDDVEIHLDGEFSARAAVVSGGSGILTITTHGDHLDLAGIAPGTVGVEFSLFHGSHSDWDSPPLSVTVIP
jgi:hypothetical protein